MLDILKKLIPTIITVAITAAVVWFITTTNQPSIPGDLKAKIDSLSKLDKQFAAQQLKLDSSLKTNEEYIKNLDTKISNIKEKITVIREYYHEQIQVVNNYTPTQVDSFFKSRYKY